jgi:hypothetical protein
MAGVSKLILKRRTTDFYKSPTTSFSSTPFVDPRAGTASLISTGRRQSAMAQVAGMRPTSPHWYDLRARTLAGAYINDDRKNGRLDRTLRAFVAEFRVRCDRETKAVLDELGAARSSLASIPSMALNRRQTTTPITGCSPRCGPTASR